MKDKIQRILAELVRLRAYYAKVSDEEYKAAEKETDRDLYDRIMGNSYYFEIRSETVDEIIKLVHKINEEK